MRVNKRKWNCVKPVASGLMVVLGIALYTTHKTLIDTLIDEVFVLKPNNYFFKEFKDPNLPIGIDFYYFNWTNPEDLKNASVKPKFEEIGPLVFNEEVHRWNVTFHENNTISYRNYKAYYFDKERSAATLEDNITTLNVIPLIGSDKARSWNYFLRKALSILLYDSPYHLTKTAKEWLFEGFEDVLLKTATHLPFLDDIPNMDKFAWFYQRNASETYEGVYNIGTGMGNTTIGKNYKWNYRNRTDYDGQCGEMEANAEIYPQNIKKEKIDLFFPDFCKRVVLDYNGTVEWNGIEAYRFLAGVNFLDNGKYNPENTCMCKRRCLKFGVLDYSKCKFGIPAYLSLPHFTQADPKYVNDVEGVIPDEKKYKLEVLLNPRTGIVIKMDMSIQLNILLEPNEGVTKYQDVPEIMFPIFWFHLTIELSTTLTILLNLLLRFHLILKIISITLIILGAYLHIRFLLKVFNGKKENEDQNNKNYLEENISLMMNKDLYGKAEIR